jgi:hypothetical protein
MYNTEQAQMIELADDLHSIQGAMLEPAEDGPILHLRLKLRPSRTYEPHEGHFLVHTTNGVNHYWHSVPVEQGKPEKKGNKA